MSVCNKDCTSADAFLQWHTEPQYTHGYETSHLGIKSVKYLLSSISCIFVNNIEQYYDNKVNHND